MDSVLIMEKSQQVGQVAAERYAMPTITKADYTDRSVEVYPRADPITTLAPDGSIYVAYQHPAVLVLHKSSDGGRSWQAVRVAIRPDQSEHGQVLAFGALADGALAVLYSDSYWTGGAHFARSEDGGVSWQHLHRADQADARSVQGLGEIKPLADGSVIATATLRKETIHQDYVWRSTDGGRTFALGGPIADYSGETSILQLPSGRLLAAIRTVYLDYEHPQNKRTALAISDDNGHTWSEPRLITSALGDCPGEFIRMPDGRLVFIYCHRYEPAAGIYAKLSEDEGQTWSDRQFVIRPFDGKPSVYPSSVLLADGTILTITGSNEGIALQAIAWKLPSP